MTSASGSALVHRIVAAERLRRVRRRFNSSRLLPGPVRQLIGGRVYMSADYRRTVDGGRDSEAAASPDGWHRATVARRQQRLWRAMPATLQQTRPDVANLMAAIGLSAPTLVMEVGCGGGYNAEIIAQVSAAAYVGVDSSAAMVALAALSQAAVLADGAALPCADRAAHTVLDGGALIHIRDWRGALAEECRVADANLILHTITLTVDAPTTTFRKRAYGFWVSETAFNREDLLNALGNHGFTLDRVWPGIAYDLSDVLGLATVSETWLCRRR